MTPIKWRKSSRSQSNVGQCVEVAFVGSDVAVRDSKDQSGPMLVCDRSGWAGFLNSLTKELA